jgi:hypothetical protein
MLSEWNNGMLERWNAVMLGITAEIKRFYYKKLLQTHHSITSSFHYSNWSEAPKSLRSHPNDF